MAESLFKIRTTRDKYKQINYRRQVWVLQIKDQNKEVQTDQLAPRKVVLAVKKA